MADSTSEEPRDFVEYAAGEEIFGEGDPGPAMFVIESGRVDILKVIRDEEQLLATLEPGEFFGEMSLLEDLPRNASARANTDCRLLRIDDAVFDDVLRARPEIASRMLRRLSRRLREFYDATERTGAIDIPGAVVAEREARLVHRESGTTFPLDPERENTVGRADVVTGRVPDIDLTSLDPFKSVSRFHAVVVGRGGRLLVFEPTPSANGTFVDGERLGPGEALPLEEGCEVTFAGVSTRFYS